MADWLLNKSAKQWVNEIGVKMMIQPKWETKEETPGKQPPTFVCTCLIIFSDKTMRAEGKGSTKKSAEQEAALAMLTKELHQTPKSLLELSNSSKSKSGGSSPRSTVETAESGQAISDTDDDACQLSERTSGFNPISELASICSLYEDQLGEPDYDEVSMEGPPHKRIFTVECKLESLGLCFTGRRQTKKIAKRIAAFRVLRLVKQKGYVYKSQGEYSGPDPIMDTSVDSLQETLEELSLNDNSSETGCRLACPEKTGKCVINCADYLHAFKHLDSSETMDKLIAEPLTELTFAKFGGSVKLLEQLAQELSIRVDYKRTNADDRMLTFVQMKLPFQCKFPVTIPDKLTLFSMNPNELEGKAEAARKAVELLRNFMIDLEFN